MGILWGNAIKIKVFIHSYIHFVLKVETDISVLYKLPKLKSMFYFLSPPSHEVVLFHKVVLSDVTFWNIFLTFMLIFSSYLSGCCQKVEKKILLLGRIHKFKRS